MKRIRVLLFCLALMATPFLAACPAPVTVVTEPGKAAYAANQVSPRVLRLQEAVIEAHQAGIVPTDTARAIVFVTVNILDLIEPVATQGWESAARVAWSNAKRDIPALRVGGQFYVLASAVDEALGGN